MQITVDFSTISPISPSIVPMTINGIVSVLAPIVAVAQGAILSMDGGGNGI